MPRRRIIRNQSIGSIIFIFLGIWPWNWWAHDPGCNAAAPGTSRGLSLCFDPGGVVLIIALLAFLAAAILYLLALIESVRRSNSMKTPRWLLVILPFGPAGTLVYSLAGPADTMRESYDWWASPKKRPKKVNG